MGVRSRNGSNLNSPTASFENEGGGDTHHHEASSSSLPQYVVMTGDRKPQRKMTTTSSSSSSLGRKVIAIVLAAVLACYIVHVSDTMKHWLSETYEDDDDDANGNGIIIPKDKPVTFEDLELLEMMGHGSVSMGFKARIKGTIGQNDTFMAKLSYRDRDLHFVDTEIEMFSILNAEPTIPNIPKLIVAINRLENPYRNKFTQLRRELGLNLALSRMLAKAHEISVIGMEFLDTEKDQWPETVDSLRIFLRSLLTTFEFAHSRNVMMCDLHSNNLYFDGEMVKIFDWNAAFIFKPDSVIMDYPEAPHHLNPPEAKKGNLHRTVSGYDIWTVGLLLSDLLETYDYATTEDENDDPVYAQIIDLGNMMLREDPYERPDATQLLKHPFLATDPPPPPPPPDSEVVAPAVVVAEESVVEES